MLMQTTAFIVFIYLILQMLIVWLIAKKIANPSIIDVAWPIGLMVSGLIYLFSQGEGIRLIVISSLLAIWACRLAGYLYFSRIKKGIVDARYVKLSQQWKISQSIGYLLHFQLQGLFIFIMSFVFMFAAAQDRTYLSLIDYLGIILCLTGIVCETLADAQLQRFKQQNKGKVCDVGLWRLSRHPNLFFDWLTWCGFACFAIQANYGWMGLMTPLLLFLIMTKATIPITENGSIASRGNQYLQYQQTTSMFFPWFMKK